MLFLREIELDMVLRSKYMKLNNNLALKLKYALSCFINQNNFDLILKSYY